MAHKALVFEDFSGGDEARPRPTKGVGNHFRATNAWVYPSGVGPRPPFMDMAYTGLPQQRLKTFNVFRSTVGSLHAVFSYADRSVYRCSVPAGAAASNVGTLSFEAVDSCNVGDEVFFVSTAGNGGKVGYNTAVTNLPNLPLGYVIERYGQQLVVATTGTILRWSELNDFSTWPTAYTVTVGSPQYIGRMFNQRNTLIVCRIDGDIWGFTGVLGVNETLRRLDTAQRHKFPLEAAGAVVNQGNLWWCGVREMAQFTGAQTVVHVRPDTPTKTGYDVLPHDCHVGHVHPLLADDEFLVVGTMDKSDGSNLKQVWFHAHRDGAWSRHLLPVTDYKCRVNNLTANQSRYVAEAVKVNTVCHDGFAFVATTSDTAAEGGIASQVFGMYSRQEFPLVPAGTIIASEMVQHTMNDGKSGLPVVAEFKTGEYWHEHGAQLTVRSVIVDYSYDPSFTPFSTYNRFDLSVEALQTPDSVAVRRSTAQAFTPAASGDSADGSPRIRGQQVFQLGDQGSGVGFRIRLDDWRGILVHRITAVVDEGPVRH